MANDDTEPELGFPLSDVAKEEADPFWSGRVKSGQPAPFAYSGIFTLH